MVFFHMDLLVVCEYQAWLETNNMDIHSCWNNTYNCVHPPWVLSQEVPPLYVSKVEVVNDSLLHWNNHLVLLHRVHLLVFPKQNEI